jgi:4-alpha-glucanotransferase
LRTSGILFPVFSLPGKYGIGGFSKEAYAFVDFLKETEQTYWQILPLGPTGYGDSPYQSFSTFAGNPYFISLEKLIEDGLLTEEECAEADAETGASIDYGKLYQTRLELLHKAFERSFHDSEPAFLEFREQNSFWLEGYAEFMVKKEGREQAFYEFLQYEFLTEWKALKAYAKEQGIRIIGDIPIYVSEDSADFTTHPELFQIDENGRLKSIAGVPPDGFSEDGQVWGNPLYNWEYHKETGYAWWLKRIEKCLELYDVIRIDHFRGFDEYFAIPCGEKTAKNGHWEKGPGISLFRAVERRFGKVPIIAEDLGYVTDGVRQLVKETGFPNMKVLEFAFDSRDSTGAMEYLPYRYNRNCVVYSGTHDNETLRGWIDDILPEERETVERYLDVRTDDPLEIVDKILIMAQSSVADTCILPLQDYLGLDNSARINHPSVLGGNWSWRMKKEDFTEELKAKIKNMTTLYGRGYYG